MTAKRKVVRKNCEISRQQVADERPVEPYNIKALSPGVPSTQPKHSEFIPWEYLNLGWSEYGVWQTINHSSPAAFGQLVSDYAFGKNDGTTYGTSQVIEPPTRLGSAPLTFCVLNLLDSDYLQNAPEELPSNPILDHAGDQVVASQRTVPHTEYAISSLHNRLDNHTRNLTLSRNIQATEAEAGPILALLSKGQKDCPICPYRQTKERMPELRRHVKTHFRKTSDNLCRR